MNGGTHVTASAHPQLPPARQPLHPLGASVHLMGLSENAHCGGDGRGEAAAWTCCKVAFASPAKTESV